MYLVAGILHLMYLVAGNWYLVAGILFLLMWHMEDWQCEVLEWPSGPQGEEGLHLGDRELDGGDAPGESGEVSA